MNFLSSKDLTSKDDDYLRVYDEVNAEGGETDEQHSDVENQKKNEVGRSSIVPKLTLTQPLLAMRSKGSSNEDEENDSNEERDEYGEIVIEHYDQDNTNSNENLEKFGRGRSLRKRAQSFRSGNKHAAHLRAFDSMIGESSGDDRDSDASKHSAIDGEGEETKCWPFLTSQFLKPGLIHLDGDEFKDPKKGLSYLLTELKKQEITNPVNDKDVDSHI